LVWGSLVAGRARPRVIKAAGVNVAPESPDAFFDGHEEAKRIYEAIQRMIAR
jgi:hypothetical protein